MATSKTVSAIQSVSSSIPVVGGVVGVGVGLVSSLFKSKKHYNLYVWDSGGAKWLLDMEGHPDAINPRDAQLRGQGYKTSIVRNKSGSAVAPTQPPAGESATPKMGNSMIWIIAGIAAAVLVVILILKRKK